jgi:hypothetical protein
MNRRTFIQGLIGLASMPMIAKYINVFKPAAVREGITQAADNTMQKGIEFYEAVIKRVMDEGTIVNESDRIRTYKHPDKPEIDVEVDLGTGNTSVNFESDYGFRAGAEITTDMDIGPRAPKELTEGELVYRSHGPEGDYSKDWEEGIIEGGITNLEDWIKMKRGYAAGGRVGMWKGGMPKGLWAAIRSIWNKYGDDAITTADEIKRPQNIVEAEETAQAIKDFNLRNPRLTLMEEQGQKLANAASDAEIELRGQFPTASDAEIKAMLPKGVKMSTESVEIWENPVKIREAVDDIFPTGDYKYDAQMASEALVENNPEVFNNMLFDDLDQDTQLKIYGAVVEVVQNDLGKMLLMKRASKPTKTLEGIEKTGTINISDPNVAEEFARFMRETDPKGAKKIDQTVELMNFNPKGRKKNAKGGHIKDDADVSLTIIEIPDISESGVESLFKRR